MYSDASGRYSIPIEFAGGRVANYWAGFPIDIETGRWVKGARAFRILDNINEAFIRCDGKSMALESDGSARDWPKDGDQSPWYGKSGKSPLDQV